MTYTASVIVLDKCDGEGPQELITVKLNGRYWIGDYSSPEAMVAAGIDMREVEIS